MSLLQTIQEHFVIERVAGGTSIAFSDLAFALVAVFILAKWKIRQAWADRKK